MRAAFGLLMWGALSGCATYMKCGFSGCAGDTTITSDVRALLNQHPALEAPNLINVQTYDHVVYLYGLVDTDWERQLAESVAFNAPSVARVVNSIAIDNRGL
jgi:osmotically-inducible protein OsmY